MIEPAQKKLAAAIAEGWTPPQPEPVITEADYRIVITWPNGRGDFVLATPDIVDGWAAQVNELRRERLAFGKGMAEAMEEAERLRAALIEIRNTLEDPSCDCCDGRCHGRPDIAEASRVAEAALNPGGTDA